MDPSFVWIYLAVLLLIPLARIIPRMLSKRRSQSTGFAAPRQAPQAQDPYLKKPSVELKSSPAAEKPRPAAEKPRSKTMLVLGALNNGLNTFESIQKNTGLGSKELEDVLGELEDKRLMAVRTKQGVLGPKIELYPTEKGLKEYYS